MRTVVQKSPRKEGNICQILSDKTHTVNLQSVNQFNTLLNEEAASGPLFNYLYLSRYRQSWQKMILFGMGYVFFLLLWLVFKSRIHQAWLEHDSWVEIGPWFFKNNNNEGCTYTVHAVIRSPSYKPLRFWPIWFWFVAFDLNLFAMWQNLRTPGSKAGIWAPFKGARNRLVTRFCMLWGCQNLICYIITL